MSRERNRTTDDGTYPEVAEELAKNDERTQAAAKGCAHSSGLRDRDGHCLDCGSPVGLTAEETLAALKADDRKTLLKEVADLIRWRAEVEELHCDTPGASRVLEALADRVERDDLKRGTYDEEIRR